MYLAQLKRNYNAQRKNRVFLQPESLIMRIRAEIQLGDMVSESIEVAQRISRMLGISVVVNLFGYDLTIHHSQNAAEMLREHELFCRRMRAAESSPPSNPKV